MTKVEPMLCTERACIAHPDWDLRCVGDDHTEACVRRSKWKNASIDAMEDRIFRLRGAMLGAVGLGIIGIAVTWFSLVTLVFVLWTLLFIFVLVNDKRLEKREK